MKKLITFLLVIMLMVSLVACGNTTNSNEPQEVTDNNITTNTDTNNTDQSSSISETVVYDTSNVKVTVTGLDQSSLLGPEIQMLFENTGDTDVTIQTEYCIVNGYMIDTTMSVDVAAGKKANDGLSLLEDSLSACGIGKFTNIQFNLIVLDSETFNKIEVSDMISLETSNTGKYTQEYDDSGMLIYDKNDIKVICKDLTTDDVFGQSLNLYIENNSNKTVIVQCDNASVNGFMISTIFSSSIISKAKAIDEMTFTASSLDENGISDIKEIEFSLIIIDEASFNHIDESESISITF